MKSRIFGIVCALAFIGNLIFSESVCAQDSSEKYDSKPYYDSPWMFGVKTNLLSDAITLPTLGLEIQLADKLSLDVNGWYGTQSTIFKSEQTSIYGASPELRLWLGEKVMSKGVFVGLHGNVCWYTLDWRNADDQVILYQNGTDDPSDPGTLTPAWSCGITTGYSLPLDKKEHWNLEFFMGVGYCSYQQKCIQTDDLGIITFEHEKNGHAGVTKLGINLTYRFSLRRYR